MEDEKDELSVTYHDKIFITKPVEIDYTLFKKQLERLNDASYAGSEETYKVLQEILPNFKRR